MGGVCEQQREREDWEGRASGPGVELHRDIFGLLVTSQATGINDI